MNVSRELLDRLSAETGFQAAALEKVVRLGAFAADVSRHPVLRQALALKGGTALNLGFDRPTRLSVDLDFNYVGRVDRAGMLDARPLVERAIADLGRRAGYQVQQSADAFAGRKLYLRYRSALGADDRIEVDLNFLFRQPLVAVESRRLWQPGAFDRPSVRTVGLAELVVGKVLAMLDRAAARDAWDVANLPEAGRMLLASPAFRPLFLVMAATLPHPLSEYTVTRFSRLVTNRLIDEQLMPMLIDGPRPDASALCRDAWTRVDPLLVLSSAETEFFQEITAGQLRLQLLFGDDDAAIGRLANHPALLWKISNVRAHLERRGRKH